MRDGITGPWSPPGPNPTEHDGENAGNLEQWSSRVRGAVLDFEIANRLAFTTHPAPADTPASRTAFLWHTGAPDVDAFSATLHPIVKFDRPDITTFKSQLRFLESYADLRPDRAIEILEQLATPAPFIASVVFLRGDTKRWTMELIDTVIRLARLVQYRIKHSLACRRPNEFSPQVQPMIMTPGHGALPSGHATEAFAAATLLVRLLKDSGAAPYSNGHYVEQLMRVAARIAINRTVAGVHFPIDSVAGAMLGVTLANYLYARAQDTSASRTYNSFHFDGDAGGIEALDFDWTAAVDPAVPDVKTSAGNHPSLKVFDKGAGGNDNHLGDDQSFILEWLWGKASEEWT